MEQEQKRKICPMMSMRIKFNAESASGNVIPGVYEGHIQYCLKGDCALWVTEITGSGNYQTKREMCGLISIG